MLPKFHSVPLNQAFVAKMSFNTICEQPVPLIFPKVYSLFRIKFEVTKTKPNTDNAGTKNGTRALDKILSLFSVSFHRLHSGGAISASI